MHTQAGGMQVCSSKFFTGSEPSHNEVAGFLQVGLKLARRVFVSSGPIGP